MGSPQGQGRPNGKASSATPIPPTPYTASTDLDTSTHQNANPYPQPITPVTAYPDSNATPFFGTNPLPAETATTSPAVGSNAEGAVARQGQEEERPTSAHFTADGNPIVPVGISGGKMYQCRGYGQCDKVFTRSEHLARHVRKHTGERPFPCHCGKAFSRLDNLRQHAATVHADATVLNESMLQSLTPVHSALSHRASREQRRRGEIVEVPKNAVERPRHNDRTASTSNGKGSVAPPDIVVAPYQPSQQGYEAEWNEEKPTTLEQPASAPPTGNPNPSPNPPPSGSYDFQYQPPHSITLEDRRQPSPASTPGYPYPTSYFPDRSAEHAVPFYRPVSANGGYQDDTPHSAHSQAPPHSPLYPQGPNNHQWSTPPPPTPYGHGPPQHHASEGMYPPPPPEMGYDHHHHYSHPAHHASPMPPQMQLHHSQHNAYGPPPPHAPPSAHGPHPGYGYPPPPPPPGSYYGPSQGPYGHSHPPSAQYGNSQYLAAGPPPSPFPYGQPLPMHHNQHTPVAAPQSLPPTHSANHEGSMPPPPPQQSQHQHDQYAYPFSDDRKRRMEEEGHDSRKQPRLSNEHREPLHGNGNKGMLQVPSQGHNGYGSASPTPSHLSIKHSINGHSGNGNGVGQMNGSGTGNQGTNTTHGNVHHGAAANANNHNNSTGSANASSNNSSSGGQNNNNSSNNNNGWGIMQDDGDLWFPPVTERRSSLAISALLGSPQQEPRRLPASMTMSSVKVEGGSS